MEVNNGVKKQKRSEAVESIISLIIATIFFAQFGIVGFILFVIILIGTIKQFIKKKPQKAQLSEKKREYQKTQYRSQNVNEIISLPKANEYVPKQYVGGFSQFAESVRSMNPEEFIELIHSIKDKSMHEIYHEASNTAHITSGICLIYNATKKEWYVGRSISLLNKVESYFSGKIKNDIYRAYVDGDTLWIKLLPLENSPCSSLSELENMAISIYDAKKI